MKILFYIRTHFDDPNNSGVVQKYLALQKAAEFHGHTAHLLTFSEKGLCLNNQTWHSFPQRKHSWKHILFYYFFANRFLKNKLDFKDYHILYLRHLPAHAGILHLLHAAKKAHPGMKIFLEIPTYPYDAETKAQQISISGWLDRHYRKKYKAAVDTILAYTKEKHIWGIPVLPVGNGVDTRAVPWRKNRPFENSNLRLIATGNWAHWHGLDRLLEGIKEARITLPETKVELHIAGGGPALPYLQKTTEKLGLSKQVHFHGPLTGAPLDKLFDQADAAVGVLGLFRKQVPDAAALKHREYTARGIPWVYAGGDKPDFEDNLPFTLKISNDEAPVDIHSLVHFLENLPVNISEQMRQYSEEYLDWTIKWKDIEKKLAE